MTYDELTHHLLEQHEGRRALMYKCPAGFNTIGVGHNLDANPISNRAIDIILEDDINIAEHDLDRLVPSWRSFAAVRRAALVDLSFNLGAATLSQFRNTLAAINRQDWPAAAEGLRNSKWFRQVGHRGPRIVGMIEKGVA